MKALGFKGIEARERRKRGRSSGVFVDVHGRRACVRAGGGCGEETAALALLN